MSSKNVTRRKGPWPSNNNLHSVRDWFRQRGGLDDSRESESVIRLILDKVSGISVMDRVITHWRASESELERLASLADRLQKGEPVQYALGETSFAGLTFQCDRRALIPRPETEELLTEALRRVRRCDGLNSHRVMDIGTGSGVLSIAWKSQRPDDDVHALDVELEALELAKINAEGLDCFVNFFRSDIFQVQQSNGIFYEPFDVIISNPPYIPNSDRFDMHSTVTEWEPSTALFVEDDNPLSFYRQIIHGCENEEWLAKGGLLALECHRNLTDQVLDLVPKTWTSKERMKDLQGNWRMVFARR